MLFTNTNFNKYFNLIVFAIFVFVSCTTIPKNIPQFFPKENVKIPVYTQNVELKNYIIRAGIFNLDDSPNNSIFIINVKDEIKWDKKVSIPGTIVGNLITMPFGYFTVRFKESVIFSAEIEIKKKNITVYKFCENAKVSSITKGMSSLPYQGQFKDIYIELLQIAKNNCYVRVLKNLNKYFYKEI